MPPAKKKKKERKKDKGTKKRQKKELDARLVILLLLLLPPPPSPSSSPLSSPTQQSTTPATSHHPKPPPTQWHTLRRDTLPTTHDLLDSDVLHYRRKSLFIRSKNSSQYTPTPYSLDSLRPPEGHNEEKTRKSVFFQKNLEC